MSIIMRRVVAASVIIGGLAAVTAGEVSAHFPRITTQADCVEGGGWQATVTIEFSEPGGTSGTVTSTYPSGSATPWQLPAKTPRTFGGGVVIPLSVGDVTFTADGSWDDGTPIHLAETVEQPDGCTPATTTIVPASTTTVPGSTTTSTPGSTTTTTPAGSTTTLPGGTVTTVSSGSGGSSSSGGSISSGGSSSSGATLPATGPTTLPAAVLAVGALGVGTLLVLWARRPARRS